MKEEEFAETVIEVAYTRTFRGDLSWHVSDGGAQASPIERIRVLIIFKDDGLGSPVWDFMHMNHPTGKESTIVYNPARDKERHRGSESFKVSALLLERIGKIFEHVVLAPRKREFEAAMEELRRSAGLSR